MEDVKIFASIIDDATKEQIKNLATSEAYKDSTIRIMPDCHVGTGCTIGSVIQYKNRVIPNTVGVDIGCGMLVIELGNINIDFFKLDNIINTFIPSGFNVHESPVTTYNVSYNASIPSEKEHYIQCSIGTLGGGNHFIEIDKDDQDNKYLVIHSGSRNLGVLICNYWQEKAYYNCKKNLDIRKDIIDKLKSEGREREIESTLKSISIPKISKELSYLEGKDLEDYIYDMALCQKYASLNRHIIADIIYSKMNWENSISNFETIHNYIDISNKIIRKGAIRANKDELVIIPMNMRDGSLICRGKGNAEWLNSAPHGAGRILSREQAKNTLSLEEFNNSMKGIYTTSIDSSTIDEAPMVYKDAKQIMKDIIPTVDIISLIKPIYNFKAKS